MNDPRGPQVAETPAAAETFYVTFGCRYAQERHPVLKDCHPEAWMEVVAPDYEAARRAAHEASGGQWAFLYTAADFDPSWHPRGCFLRIEVPAS